MFTKFFVSALVLVGSALGLLDKFEGKVNSVDANTNRITIDINGKPRTFTVDATTKYLDKDGEELPNVKGLGSQLWTVSKFNVKLETEMKDGKEYVASIQLPVKMKMASRVTPNGNVATAAPVGPGPESWEGKALPKFEMTKLDGKKIATTSLKGKVLLIDFWATWCGPCKMASPVMQKLHEKYASKGLMVIGANTMERGDAKKLAGDYAKEHGYKYTFTYGNDAFSKQMNVRGIPTMLIVDKKGVVNTVNVGYSERLYDKLEAAIKPLLKK
ncbi:MAG: hypothetical protein BGO01_13635 [Armatimonadetes bacterium 55-13]|nr:TlpA family protein disulfide reductase [Armatimonadota bacterium]OJU64769.1 MAG: hypothetical protein BGO01_13635 [Armatimonadetes bacterium 55-13]